MSRPKSLFQPPAEAGELLSRAECETIAKRALALARADETRVTIQSTVRGDTRFAVNQISTSGDDVDATITIRSTFGKRTATITTNKFDDAALAEAMQNAEALARLSPEDPEFVPELGAQNYDPQAASRMTMVAVPTPDARAAAIHAITRRAHARGLIATGYVESQLTATAIATSRGLFGYQSTGAASMTTTVRTADGTSSGWAGGNATNWSDIDADALGAHAIEKVTHARHSREAEPGYWTVILEPTAVGNLVQLINTASQARAADEGRSVFSKQGGGNKIGTKIADERVTLVSDPADAGGVAFTSEGLPAERVTWIEKGVLRTLSYDRYWAAKTGNPPTAAPPNTMRMNGGAASIPQMVAATKMGILVTRFWYIRPVDPRTLLYTGLTRDGTFFIENGKIKYPIMNFRFNDSPIFMLNRVEMLGRPVRVSASEDGSPGANIIVPPIRCHDFRFSSVSDAV